MKYILLSVALVLILTAQTHAGIFEYYLGEPTPTTPRDPDTIESFTIESQPTRTYSLYQQPHTPQRYNTIDPGYSYELYPNESYYEYIRHKNGYYQCHDAKSILRNEQRMLEREADDIDEYKRDMYAEKNRLRRYKPYGYQNAIHEIEYHIDRVEVRERDVEEAIQDIKQDIRHTSDDCRYDTEYYYFDDRYYGGITGDEYCHVYEETTPYRAYSTSRHSYYTAGKESWYEVCRYEPSWVNPNLKYLEKDEGYIYIR